MGSFFDLDGPFARFGNMLIDLMFLSLLWIVFSLPVFTVGAATTALFYVTTRRISNKEGYLLRDFWKSFRQNFKQATIVWLTILVSAIILFANIQNVDVLGSSRAFILPLQLCIALELYAVSAYIFPLLSRFELSTAELFRSSFFMANRHLPTTIVILALGSVLILISYATVVLSIFAVGIYALVASHLFMRIFKKYRPEIDGDRDLE